MADKGFGIRQLNLIGASGTPKIESPNNLNLNAVTVAISTDVTIGGQVTSNIIVGTGKSVGIGTTLPTNTLTVVGSGTSTSQLFVTGISTVGIVTGATYFGDGSRVVDGRWTLGASADNNGYTFTGIGFTETTNDPILYLARGGVYEFVNNMNAHPFRIQSMPNGSAGTEYNNGVTGNNVLYGTLRFEVPFNAPSILYYQCTIHSNMGGIINILDETFPVNSNAYGTRTVQSGGTPTGGNDGDIYYIY